MSSASHQTFFRSHRHLQHICSPSPVLGQLHSIPPFQITVTPSKYGLVCPPCSPCCQNSELLPGLQMYPERQAEFPHWLVFIFLLHGTHVMCKVCHCKTNIVLFPLSGFSLPQILVPLNLEPLVHVTRSPLIYQTQGRCTIIAAMRKLLKYIRGIFHLLKKQTTKQKHPPTFSALFNLQMCVW